MNSGCAAWAMGFKTLPKEHYSCGCTHFAGVQVSFSEEKRYKTILVRGQVGLATGIMLLVLHHHHRDGKLSAMRQAQLRSPHPHRPSQLTCPPAEVQRRPLAHLPSHLNLLPVHSAADSGSQRLGSGLLRGNPRSKALRRLSFRSTLSNLACGEYSFQKPLSKTVHAYLYPFNLDQIRSQPQHHSAPRNTILLHPRTTA